MLKTYNFKHVYVIVGGSLMTGLAPDSPVTAYRNEQAFSFQPNADGGGTRSRSNNTSGGFKIPLMQTSDSNDALSLLESVGTTFPVLLKDNNGRTVASAGSAWVQKLPDVEFGVEATHREWVLECDHIDIFVGGN